MYYFLEANLTFLTAIITGGVTVLVALDGVLGNWYMSNQNKKRKLNNRSINFYWKT